jgi:hypothetical protein
MSLDVSDSNIHQVINDLQVIVWRLEDLKRPELTRPELLGEVDRLLQIILDAGKLLRETRKELQLPKTMGHFS